MSVPTPEALHASRVFEAARRPMALKVTDQYKRGLLTFLEMVEQLTEIDLKLVHAKGPVCTNHDVPAEWLVTPNDRDDDGYLSCTDCARPAAFSSNIEPITYPV